MLRTKRNDIRSCLFLLNRSLQKRSHKSISILAPAGSSSSGHQHENSSRFPIHLLTTVFITTAICAAVSCSPSHCDSDDKKDRKALAALDIPTELRQRLKKIREPMGRNYPTITFSHDGNQQTLGILLDVHRDVNGLLKSWTGIFGDESVVPAELSEKKVEFSSADKKKRIYVRRNGNRTTSVWIVHDEGFCSEDLYKITEGYAVSCAPSTFSSHKVRILPFLLIVPTHVPSKYSLCPSTISTSQDHGSSSSSSSSSNSKGVFPFEFSFHLGSNDEDHDGYYDDKFNQFFPLELFKRKDPPLHHHGSQTGVAKDTKPFGAHNAQKPMDSAVTKLRRLGVEVFDQTVNADLSWDCLAGYDHVKQEIEETIVNSLKYPGV